MTGPETRTGGSRRGRRIATVLVVVVACGAGAFLLLGNDGGSGDGKGTKAKTKANASASKSGKKGGSGGADAAETERIEAAVNAEYSESYVANVEVDGGNATATLDDGTEVPLKLENGEWVPQVDAPEASTPEVSTPSAEVPEASAPQVDAPQVQTPQVQTPSTPSAPGRTLTPAARRPRNGSDRLTHLSDVAVTSNRCFTYRAE